MYDCLPLLTFVDFTVYAVIIDKGFFMLKNKHQTFNYSLVFLIKGVNLYFIKIESEILVKFNLNVEKIKK